MSRLLVFSDLDGTLLDHHSYSYEEALPAIQALSGAGYPLIFNSSKTAVEVRQLRQDMANIHPFIVENGSAVCIPSDYFNCEEPGSCLSEEFVVHTFGPRYQEMIEQLHDLRKDAGYKFSGFYDLSDEDVARLTGLEVADATKARQREASEPILWKDSACALEAFERQLNMVDLTLTKGGRFYHVMGLTDKAQAMHWLASKYRTTWQKQHWCTVALGDGPNDRLMLEAADIAVVIPSESGETLRLSRAENLITAETPGPSGWQTAIECIMKSNQTRKGA